MSPQDGSTAGSPAAVSARTRRAEEVSAYLQQHPGQPLRYEQIAAAVQLSNEHASIALSGLLRGDLPGLARVGRGTYRWDAPGPAQQPGHRAVSKASRRRRAEGLKAASSRAVTALARPADGTW